MEKTRKRKFLKTLCVALFIVALSSCAALSVGCKKDEPPAAVATVSIDKDALTIPEWESALLTAEKTGTDETIVWSSADETVATVKDGLVSAVGRGETTVTASAGQASDTCKITVVQSDVEPTVTVNELGGENALTVKDGDSFDVSVSVKWNAQPLDGAAVTFTSDDDAVATVVGNGYSATVTGVKEGDTVIRIQASVRGKTAVATFSVRVNPVSALLKTDDEKYTPTAGGYKVVLNAVEENTGDGTNATVPDFYATYKKQTIENPDVVWTTEDSDVIEIDGVTGQITAKKAGDATVTGVWHYDVTDKDYSVKISVEVVKVNVSLSGVRNVVVNRPAAAATLTLSDETVESFSVDDKTYTDGFSISGDSVTFDNAKFDVADQTKVLSVTVSTDKRVYSFSAESCYAIANLDEWKAIWNATTAAQVFGKSSVIKLESDIDASSYNHNGNINYATMTAFSGIFDGQGHTVKGATAGWASLFNSVAEDGVVKNVAFVGTKLLKEAKVFYVRMDGTIENCYFEGYASRSDVNATPALSNVLGRNAVIRNVVVNISGRAQNGNNANQKALFNTLSGDGDAPVISGFYAFVDCSDGTASSETSVNGAINLYSSMTDMRAAVTALPENFSEEYWQTYDELLSFKSSQSAISAYIAANAPTVESITSVSKETETLLSADKECSWRIEGLDSTDYTLVNGALTLTAQATVGDTFTIVAVYTEERYGHTYEIKIENVLIKKKPAEVKNLSENYVVGLNRTGSTFAYTLDEAADILSVTVGGAEIDGANYSASGSVVTLNLAAFTKTGSVEVLIETENAVYKANATVADYAIGTLDEFKSFWNKSVFTASTVSVYAVLTADIDASSYSFNGGTVIANCTFDGVIDGRGHTVSGVHSGYYGLFYNLGANSVIRNVAFTGIRFYRVSAIVNYKLEGRMENCYFEGTGGSAADNNALAKQIGATAVIENVVVYLHDRPAGTETQKGVFVSTVLGAAVTTAPKGVYVINTSCDGNICNTGLSNLINTDDIHLYSSLEDFRAKVTARPDDISEQYWNILAGL